MDLLSDPDTIPLQQTPSLSPIKAKGKPNMVSTNHDYLRFHHLYNSSGGIFVAHQSRQSSCYKGEDLDQSRPVLEVLRPPIDP